MGKSVTCRKARSESLRFPGCDHYPIWFGQILLMYFEVFKVMTCYNSEKHVIGQNVLHHSQFVVTACPILNNSLVYKWRWIHLFNVRRLVRKVGPPMISIWQRNSKSPKSFCDSPSPFSIQVDRLLTPARTFKLGNYSLSLLRDFLTLNV
jgi:hypothetical protein